MHFILVNLLSVISSLSECTEIRTKKLWFATVWKYVYYFGFGHVICEVVVMGKNGTDCDITQDTLRCK